MGPPLSEGEGAETGGVRKSAVFADKRHRIHVHTLHGILSSSITRLVHREGHRFVQGCGSCTIRVSIEYLGT